MFQLVTNVYRNIPTDEKIKLYLKFCEYLTKEQLEYEGDESNKTDQGECTTDGKENQNNKCL